MVSKCANPTCSTPFRYLRGGRLFLVTVPHFFPQEHTSTPTPNQARTPEYFWLCEECSATMQVTLDKRGMVELAAVDSARRSQSLLTTESLIAAPVLARRY